MDILERLRGYNPPDRTNDDQRQIAVDIYDAATEIARLRDALGVIARNVDAGAVHISWCSDYAKRSIANAALTGGEAVPSNGVVGGKVNR